MNRKVKVDMSSAGIDKLQKSLEEYEKWLNRKTQELVKRLADEGVEAARFTFDIAVYDGKKDVKVYAEPRDGNVVAVVAVGSSVLFLEFGAGYLLGYGHPEPMEYGPGTYPGKGHWDDPNGWYLPKEVQEEVGHERSIGNPPSAAMYNALKELEDRIQEIASEVFAT